MTVNKKVSEVKELTFFSKHFFLILLFVSFCVFAVTSRVILLFDGLYIPWPGKQILSSILYLNGFLQYDYYVNTMNGSLYEFSALLLSKLFYGSLELQTLQYSFYSIIFDIINLMISSLIIWKISTKFIETFSPNLSTKLLYAPLLIFITIILAFLLYLPHNISQFILPRSAGWSLPVVGTLNPQGLSWVLTLFALWIGFNTSKSSLKNLAIIGFLGFISTLLHPVIPLVGFILFTSLIILLTNTKYPSETIGVSLVLAISYILGIFIIIFVYVTPSSIDFDLYKIYVVERHPHHYLPSQYFSFEQLIMLIFQLVIIFFFFKILNKLNLKRSLIILALATVPHLTQYFFVEILQIKQMILLGPSRLIIAFNIVFLSSLFGILVLSLLKFINGNFKLILEFIPKIIKLLYYPAIICSLLLVITTGYLNFSFFGKKIAERSEYEILKVIKNNGWTKFDLQVLDFGESNSTLHTLLLREISGLSVYNDNYFPFSLSGMQTWSLRRKEISDFVNCYSKETSQKSCAEIISSKPIVGITHRQLTKNGIKILQKNGRHFWVELIE